MPVMDSSAWKPATPHDLLPGMLLLAVDAWPQFRVQPRQVCVVIETDAWGYTQVLCPHGNVDALVTAGARFQILVQVPPGPM